MNDQLRTLVRQAVISVDIVTGNESLDDELAKMYIPDCFAERFAELIVRECIRELEISRKCDPYTGNLFDCEYNICINEQTIMLKEHFGVEL